MSYVGKLPQVGTRPALIIYRCDECSRAVAEEAWAKPRIERGSGKHPAHRQATVGAIVTAALTGQFALPPFTGPNLNEVWLQTVQ
jgi:hypothetical protein